MWVWRYVSNQVCKFDNMRVYNYVIMHLCMYSYASMQVWNRLWLQVCEYSNQNFVWRKGQLKDELECSPAQPNSSYPDLAWQDYIIKCKLLLYLCLHVLAQHAFIMFHSLHANCNFMLVYCRHMFYKIILILQLLRHKMKTTVKISIEDKYHKLLDLYCQTPRVRAS